MSNYVSYPCLIGYLAQSAGRRENMESGLLDFKCLEIVYVRTELHIATFTLLRLRVS